MPEEDLRARAIRLAGELPKGSPARKALVTLLAATTDPVHRGCTFSPGPTNDTGPSKDYARWLHIQLVAFMDTGLSPEAIAETRKTLFSHVDKMISAVRKGVDAKLNAAGYRFRKELERPRLHQSRNSWSRTVSCTIDDEFTAPTESWTETREEGEVELRGVRDPFPPVPLEFLRDLKVPLLRAMDAREGRWDFGSWKFTSR